MKGRTMENKKSSKSGGFGLAGILTVVFAILKLVGVISWSWFWVLSPLWISFLPIITVILLGIMVFIGGTLLDITGKILGKKRR